ncbi:MAG: hypothetical protein AB8G86_18050 [Saprospiraceae bacterium]
MEKRYKETYDLEIDKYITKKMDEADSAAFEKIMAVDDSLQDEVAFREGLIKAMKWKQQINIAHAEMVKKKAKSPLVIASQSTTKATSRPIRRIGFRKVFAYAASVSLLVLAGLSWFANNNFSDQQLADNYVSSIVSLDGGNLKGGDNNSKDPFEKGLYYLEQKDYTQAASFFETVPIQNEDYAKARLHLAFSQYHTSAFAAATQNANIVIQESFDTIDKQKATWLVIQALLKQGKKDADFFLQLKGIAEDSTHIYQKAAKKLQKDLNNVWRKLVL